MTLGVLLGPQRHAPTLHRELARWGIPGPLAVITAGWQEREAEDDELVEHVGHRCVNLELHARSEDSYANDPELFAAHRAKQDTLRQMQALYRRRLAHAIDAAREVSEAPAPEQLVETERTAAILALRLVDEQHLARTRQVQRQFQAAIAPATRPAVEHHYRELRSILGECYGLLIAGGHVASLLNRIRLFQLVSLLASLPRPLPIFAWSAGAMALTERVVLFHDSPPQGPGNAEVLGEGLGLLPDVVVLPHAQRRLRLDDPARVSLFAQRFGPSQCVPLEEDDALAWDGRSWHQGPKMIQLQPSGEVTPLKFQPAEGAVTL
ncbi:MAG: Type 1 glutamine amidotransferase-like domain-containing protein [Deltaproteobacteria bacterium]|nr:Type 1 glutamine amidotransferase-like domain-containing protein [Deltaproteobacteria bacterium]